MVGLKRKRTRKRRKEGNRWVEEVGVCMNT